MEHLGSVFTDYLCTFAKVLDLSTLHSACWSSGDSALSAKGQVPWSGFGMEVMVIIVAVSLCLSSRGSSPSLQLMDSALVRLDFSEVFCASGPFLLKLFCSFDFCHVHSWVILCIRLWPLLLLSLLSAPLPPSLRSWCSQGPVLGLPLFSVCDLPCFPHVNSASPV